MISRLNYVSEICSWKRYSYLVCIKMAAYIFSQLQGCSSLQKHLTFYMRFSNEFFLLIAAAAI